MNELEFAPRFKRDHKKIRRHPEYERADFLQLLEDMIEHKALPDYYGEHALEKRAINWASFTECHLSGDLVVIYKRHEGLVKLLRIGAHASVF